MTLIELKEDIMHKKLKNFYVFTGTEIGIMNIYLEQMSRIYGVPITRTDSVAKVYGLCTTKSLFGNTKHFYVIREDTDFTKQEKAYETISKDIGNNVIVLSYEKLDSRLKFGKYFKDVTVQFDVLDVPILVKYIQRTCKNLTSERAKYIVDVCERRYDECMLEVDKINQYAEATQSDVNKAFDTLVAQKAIYQPTETNVFEFSDAVCSYDVEKSFAVEQQLREDGVSSIVILGTLYNNLKAVMLMQCCNKGEDIAKVTGLDKGAIYYNRKYVDKHTTEHLVYGVQLIQQIIDGVKKGMIDDVYATRYMLTKYL